MLRRFPRAWLPAVPLLYCLYFYGLTTTGLLGPDEPRYAAIGREMAHSGDWVTPRLWGQPWFEKPALLYWMTGAGFRLGLGDDLAPRLPVALLGVAFLVFFQRTLEREFGARPAWYATAILGTSAGWLGFSHVGVTDLPMAASFAASMLLALGWIKRGDTRRLPISAASLGLAVLAKGLAPVVLALPLLWTGRRRWRDLLRWHVPAAFALVAVPWYAACYVRNGAVFLETFFWRHHVGRFLNGGLQHQQPFWFYFPVLLAALLPWTPLLALAARRSAYADPRRRFLLLWLLFGLVFFSLAVNKLPGYLLPLLPAAAALAGIALAETGRAALALALCPLALVMIPALAPILPAAVESGLSRAPRPVFAWTWLVPAILAAIVWMAERRRRRPLSVGLITASMAVGMLYLERAALPGLDRSASARSLWREIASRRDLICLQDLQRDWRYGLNYYSVMPLPDCSHEARPERLIQLPGRRPALAPPAITTRLDP